MLSTRKLKEFLAKQLNDHKDSASGVVQPTYFEWSEQHICDAIDLGICYLYSLVPSNFSKVQSHTITEPSCIVDLGSVCGKFMNVVDLEIDGVACIEVNEEDTNSVNLAGMLDIGCTSSSDGGETITNSYSYDVIDNSNGVVKFDGILPIGTKISYLCSESPSIDLIDDTSKCEYFPMIADYALWWLYRTDSESVSNLDRARLHYQSLSDFVQLKLGLEFSLREDDYNFLRRKVDDD